MDTYNMDSASLLRTVQLILGTSDYDMDTQVHFP